MRLVEIGRRTAGGGFVPVISEADGYRLALDCRQLTREAHDIEVAKRWALMIEIAAFRGSASLPGQVRQSGGLRSVQRSRIYPEGGLRVDEYADGT